MKYEVRSVVCDYGVYEDDKHILILNKRRNAEEIVKILEADLKNKYIKYVRSEE